MHGGWQIDRQADWLVIGERPKLQLRHAASLIPATVPELNLALR
jgi:hypothetical protein